MGENLKPTKRKGKFPPGAKYLIATMADTTWRMFVPTIGGMLLGLYIDQKFGIMPWLTLTGLAIGIVLTTMLVRAQLARGVRRTAPKGDEQN